MRSVLLQAVVFVLIFNGISWYRELALLSSNDHLVNRDLVSLSAEKHSVINSKGVHVVYFFAPWCSVCHVSIDNLELLKSNNPDLSVVAVALDYDSQNEVINFAKEHELSMPILLGTNTFKHQFKVQGYPTYYIFSDGELKSKSLGYSSYLGLKIRTLLAS